MAEGLCIVEGCNQVKWHAVHSRPYGDILLGGSLSHAFVGATKAIDPTDEEQKVSELGPIGPSEHVRDRVTGPSGSSRRFAINMHTPVTIKEWQYACYENSKAHGFHDNSVIPGIASAKDCGDLGEDTISSLCVIEKLALIHSEVSEALEDVRDGKMEESVLEIAGIGKFNKPVGFPSELADIVIRVLDLSGMLGIDLEGAMRRKHEYNKGRPYKHGKKF